MDNRTVKFPNYTIGPDAMAALPEILRRFGDELLVVGGKKALEKAGPKLKRALKQSRVKRSDLMWYGGECTRKNGEAVEAEIRRKGCNLVLGVGGGKALDTAKWAAGRAGVPIITVPTIAATCAAVTALSILYTDTGLHEGNHILKDTPVHVVIDMEIIAESPCQYLRAGMGDTLAKYYEVELNLRHKNPDHSQFMARQLCVLCRDFILSQGAGALLACEENNSRSKALAEVVLTNIVTTGMVSLLVGDENNASVAHGVCHGLSAKKEIKEQKLHGDLVAYGVLILLIMDGNKEELKRLHPYYNKIGWPVSFADLGLKDDETLLAPILEKTAANEESKKAPFAVTLEALYRAFKTLERFRPGN